MGPQPRVSINIPCYRQLPYARSAVASVLAQSFDDFELTLLDDGASDEYEAYVSSLADPRVRYERNRARLGAMGNMFAAIRHGRGPYTLAFHEDDLLGRHYVEAAISILDRDPHCGFVAGQLREFQTEPSAAELSQPWNGDYIAIAQPADYLRAIFRGIEPMFGSIVYRRAALAEAEVHHDRYATLVDRPFLLSILRGWSAAIVRGPLAWYRRHDEGGDRHTAMSADHIIELLATYRTVLAPNWTPEDKALFFSYSRAWLFELLRLVPSESRPPLWRFLLGAWKRGVYRPTLRGHLGLWHLRKSL